MISQRFANDDHLWHVDKFGKFGRGIHCDSAVSRRRVGYGRIVAAGSKGGSVTDNDQTERKQSWITVLGSAAVLLSPAAYLLSVGPFVWLFNHGYMSQKTYVNLSLLYMPLAILRDNCEPFRHAIEWYISWFK